MKEWTSQHIASSIDHTLLKPDASSRAIFQLCEEAKIHQFHSVCVQSAWVKTCEEILNRSAVKIAAVVGFPLGAESSEVKAFEAKCAVRDGATEIDMVMTIGTFLEGNEQAVLEDIAQVAQAIHNQAILKVIIETGYLTDEQKRRACQIAEKGGAHFVKTSTGFGPGGATEADIQLMRESVSLSLGVKASGGIRDRQTAIRMLEAGATRIGTSAGVAIMHSHLGQSNY